MWLPMATWGPGLERRNSRLPTAGVCTHVYERTLQRIFIGLSAQVPTTENLHYIRSLGSYMRSASSLDNTKIMRSINWSSNSVWCSWFETWTWNQWPLFIHVVCLKHPKAVIVSTDKFLKPTRRQLTVQCYTVSGGPKVHFTNDQLSLFTSPWDF